MDVLSSLAHPLNPMMKAVSCSLLLAAALTTGCATQPTDSTITVVHLRHTEAFQMRDTLNQFLADARASGEVYPSIRIADNGENSLLIEGQPEQVKKVLRLIENIDQERPR